jgi:ATP synthase protein I
MFPAQLEAAVPRSSGRDEAAIMSVDGSKPPDPRGKIAPEDREALRRRSDAIGQRLDEVARKREAVRRPQGSATAGRAMRASAELIGGIVAGGLIGWYLDKWLGTEKPIMFVLFFLLGAAAGILNVIRVAMREKTPPAPSVPDDDEDENR